MPTTSEAQQPGSGGTDYVARLAGDGNLGPPWTTGWQLFTVDLGTLAAGSHTVTLGGYNSMKTSASEFTDVLVDDVLMTASSAPDLASAAAVARRWPIPRLADTSVSLEDQRGQPDARIERVHFRPVNAEPGSHRQPASPKRVRLGRAKAGSAPL